MFGCHVLNGYLRLAQIVSSILGKLKKMEVKKMTEFKARGPDYKGDGLAVWVEEFEGKPVLKVSVLGGKAVWCFKNEPKSKPKELSL